MTDMLSGTPGPLRDHKLDERFEYVLYCLRTAGFESFDGLVTAYYSSSFDESSTLAMEQRLSRNRGLPNVIAELFRSAGCWSDWERRGFHEELLKTTEMMLITESKKVPVGSLSMALQNGEAAAQSIPAMKTAIQNEVSLPGQPSASSLRLPISLSIATTPPHRASKAVIYSHMLTIRVLSRYSYRTSGHL